MTGDYGANRQCKLWHGADREKIKCGENLTAKSHI
jgi:hypothetical protein